MPEYLDGNMDVITQPAPALSATSDMPTVEAPAKVETKVEEAATEQAAEPTQETAATETQETQTGEVAAEPPAKEPRGVGKALKERDDQIAAERKRADDLAAQVKESNERLARLEKLMEKANEPPAPQEAPRPKREEFNDPDAYEEALIEWSGNRAAAVAQKKLADAQAEADAKRVADEQAAEQKALQDEADRQWNEVRSKHMERVEKAEAAWDDYKTVTEADDLKITPNMAYTIMQLENGPAIAYHLGKTPAEAERISKLPVPMQIAEIGRLAALVAGPRAAAPKPPPPAPITPLETNRGRAEASPSLNDMATEDYVATRLKEMGSAAATRH